MPADKGEVTTSKADEDILRAYRLGANSFITKPINFQSLLETVEIISRYWFNVVELPSRSSGVQQ